VVPEDLKRVKKQIASIFIFAILSALLLPSGSAAADDQFPHYVEENEQRYEAYQRRNPNVPYGRMLAYVNAKVDKDIYSDITTVENPDKIYVIVNQNFSLPQDYEPGDLVSIGNTFMLRKEAARHLEKMRAEMLAQGLRIYVVAAYRTSQTQTYRYNNALANEGRYYADTRIARPGHSEHQTGLAVDILQRTGDQYMSHAGFQNTREYAWLKQNAHRYGFIHRYPMEHMDYHRFVFEAWHWRYVGPGIATVMHENGMGILEEYYGTYLAPEVREKRAVSQTQESRAIDGGS